MEQVLEAELLRSFPALEGLPPALREGMSNDGVPMAVPAGTVLFEANSPCRAFPMLLSGSIRVVKAGSNGRELPLYRVLPGESCIITSSCLLGDAAYPARGVAESEISAVVVSKALFHRLVEGHPPFRSYIFKLFSGRLSELMDLVEEVAFRKLDQRLAALLLAKGRTVHATHQNLADELGSVREIISRLLKQFQDQGLVTLGREQIQVLDPERLRGLCN